MTFLEELDGHLEVGANYTINTHAYSGPITGMIDFAIV